MNIGMLWFDNDPKVELTTKVERAAIYYRNKYGRSPTLCFVHPSMLAESIPAKNETTNIKASSIEIRSTPTVLPNHFWIGVNGINIS